jgi:hypothetical protein
LVKRPLPVDFFFPLHKILFLILFFYFKPQEKKIRVKNTTLKAKLGMWASSAVTNSLFMEAREPHNSKDNQQFGPEPLFFADPALVLRKLLPVLFLYCLV